MNSSFGYNRHDDQWLSTKRIITNLIDTVSKGGNYLLNVGPTAEGLIPEPCVKRLCEVGAWLDVNGDAIYGTSPWRVFRETVRSGKGEEVEVRFTAKGDTVHAACLTWPAGGFTLGELRAGHLAGKRVRSVTLLGSDEKPIWTTTTDGLKIETSADSVGRHAFVFRIDLAPSGE